MKALSGISLVLFLLLTGTTAMGQGVTVQSGDHAGFTRLVASIGAQRDWDVTRIDDTVQIRLTPDVPAFNLSGVFNLIGRDRLAEIRADEDGLQLDLACDCTVTLERYQDRFMIIDIDDTPYSPPIPEAEIEETAAPVDPQPPAVASTPLPLLVETDPVPDLPALPFREPRDTQTPGIDITEAGNALAEQLARATAAGLLEVAPGQPPTRADPADPADSSQPVTEGSDSSPAPGTEPDAPPLEMANAFDLNENIVSERLIPPASTSCVTPPARHVADWSRGMSFANGLGALRAGLYDDRGQLVADRAQLLAEFYLFHGFGAEAAFWLSQAELTAPFHSGLARYLEYAEHGTLGRFDMQDRCDPVMAFWLFLTGPTETRPDAEARARILAEFYALPAPMRDLFGPDLARNFVAVGDDASAMEVRENLGRGGRLAGENLTLLDLELAETASDMPPPPAHVSSVNAVTAMTFRLRAQIEANGRANAADLMAAEALILETNPRPDQNGLVHVAALAHALAGNLDPIMQHLSTTMATDADAAMPIFTDVVDILMDQGQTAQLLILLSSPEFGQYGHFPSPAYRRQVADYFLAHGLPGLARDIIMAGGTDRAPDREILTTAFERISRDVMDPPVPESGPVRDIPRPAPATSATEIAEILEESRAAREAVSSLLAPMPGS